MTENFTKEMVDSLAEKLLIGLTSEENKTVLSEFETIKESMDLISNIPSISESEIQSYPYDFICSELRKDEKVESIDYKTALNNCDLIDGREVEVPKVVG